MAQGTPLDDEREPLEKCVRQLHLRGFEVLETEFQWSSQQRLRSDYQAFELHCRLQPYNVLAQCWHEGGAEAVIGRLCLLLPGRQYHARALAKDEVVRTVVCRFDREWIPEATGRDIDWDRIDPGALLDIHHPHIERSMRRIAEEVARPGFGTETLIEALCTAVAIDLVRHFDAVSGRPAECAQGLSERRLERIKELVRSSEGKWITAEDIALDLGMSATYLRRLFRNTTGQTLHEFLEEARIARACALLTETDTPLKVVAFLSGFAQHSTFSYAFKRKMGLTPSEYRTRKLI